MEEANFTEENPTSTINQDDEEAMEIDESISYFLEDEKTKINDVQQQLHHQQKEDLAEEHEQGEEQEHEHEHEHEHEQEQEQEQEH